MQLTTTISLCFLSVLAINNEPTHAAPVGDTPRAASELLAFLSKYGYLQTVPDDDDNFQSEEIISDAIRTFQKFTGLEITGMPDTATLDKLKTPRCGFPDIVSSYSDGSGPHAYNAMGSRWRQTSIKWSLTQKSAKLGEREQLAALDAALDLWAKVTPLTFQQSPHDPDIEMKFVRGEHGDGAQNSFDGQGRVLAHAYGPGRGVGGDAHFDEDEAWTIGREAGTDLVVVAAHEFGHSLGLGHSEDPEALMAPYYAYSPQPSLKKDDIQGIQFLYGPKTRTERPGELTTASLPTAAITRTTTTSIPTTTTTTTTTTPKTTTPKTTTTTSGRNTTNSSMPAFCGVSFRLDAICAGPDGFMYAFRDDFVYRLGPRGLESGYPKLISQVFPQAPKASVDAATYNPDTMKTFIFKGFQVWRYTNFTLDVNYPKIWTDAREYIPSAAVTLTYRGHSQIFMFSNGYFWDWNPNTEQLVPGYPLAMKKYFPYSPQQPDAAFMNSQGHFIFFKGNSLKHLEQRGKNAEAMALGPNLFGPVCGGDPELLSQLGQGSSNSQPANNQGNRDRVEPAFSSLIWDLVRRMHKKNHKTHDTSLGSVWLHKKHFHQ